MGFRCFLVNINFPSKYLTVEENIKENSLKMSS